jgi:hypothetical protein
VHDLLQFLINCGLKFTIEQINFDHLTIRKGPLNKTNKYRYYTKKYNFNLIDRTLTDSNTVIILSELSNSASYLDILNKIKDITDKLKNPQTMPSLNKKLIPSAIKQTDKVIKNQRLHQLESIVTPIASVLTENNHIQNKEIDDVNSEIVDPTELENQIKKLNKIKNDELKTLDELKNNHKNTLDNFIEHSNEYGDKKRFFNTDKERAKEKRNIFNSDKNVYRQIKLDIEKGKLKEENISELFVDKFQIFKMMEEYDLLDKENEYGEYVELYEEIYPSTDTVKQTDKYVPHNINYLDESERSKYKKETTSENLEDSEHKNASKTSFPSLDQIMDSVENDQQIHLKTTKNENLENIISDNIPDVDFE